MTAREKAKAAYKEIYGQDVEMGGRKAGERNPGLEIVTIIERALLDTSEETSRKPWLGNATTRELFEELMARVGDANLEYKTTETDEERKKRFSFPRSWQVESGPEAQPQGAAEIRKMGEEKP